MKTITWSSGSKLGLLLCVAGLLLLVPPQARADEDKDPPTRVARISIVEGSVSLQPGGQGDWGEAARNRPMTIGDKLWVDNFSFWWHDGVFFPEPRRRHHPGSHSGGRREFPRSGIAAG